MSQANLVEMLKKAGFTENEAKCYLALLERDSLSVNEVAKLSGIVRPSAYDVLEKLMSNGFVAIVPGNIKRYTALDPWILKEKSLKLVKESATMELEEFKKRQHVLLEKKIEELSEREEAAKSSIDKLVKMLEPIFNTSRDKNNPLDYIEILKNPEHSQRRYMQLYSQAKTEIIAFVRSPFFLDTKKIRDKHKKDIRAAAKRGVRVRSICEIPENEAERKELYKNLKGYSDELKNNIVRVVKKLPTKMVVFDTQTVLFTLTDPIQSIFSTTSLVTEHEEMAWGFKELFESYWEKAQDFEILNNRECFTPKK